MSLERKARPIIDPTRPRQQAVELAMSLLALFRWTVEANVSYAAANRITEPVLNACHFGCAIAGRNCGMIDTLNSLST